jgi:hypothetical protein
MALHFGKVGTRRVTGIQRAQLQKLDDLCISQLSFNGKEAARVPPLVYLTGPQQNAFQAASAAAQALLAQKN